MFALPSLLEALPTVAVEALASGTPVVSADHPGGVELHELFGDDVQVVPKGQVSGLADALDESLRSPRARVARDARSRGTALQSGRGADGVSSASTSARLRQTCTEPAEPVEPP